MLRILFPIDLSDMGIFAVSVLVTVAVAVVAVALFYKGKR